ncbi:MAG: fibronectin type III domain-containing protein, partial [Lentisphaeria bacterium]|nr:fibronectin type III domain-containing protein [Lentisphaeria bacterium]
MKRVFFCLVSLLFFAVCAGMPADYSDWRFTGDFRIYHHNKLTPEDAAAAVYGKPVRKLECKILPSLENCADFNALFGYAEPVSRRIAVVVNRIETAKAGRIQFGVGADWLMVVYVDGKKVLDTREMGGNGSAPAKKTDHVVDVELARGVHTVSFWISSGSTTWSVAAGKIPYTKVIYPAGKLKYGPYITDVSNNGAVVSFITEHPAPSGIALRKRGDKEFRNCWSHSGYQIDPNKRVHRINVDGLEPDTVYEYKITFLERPDNRQVYHDRLFSFRTAAQGFK